MVAVAVAYDIYLTKLKEDKEPRTMGQKTISTHPSQEEMQEISRNKSSSAICCANQFELLCGQDGLFMLGFGLRSKSQVVESHVKDYVVSKKDYDIDCDSSLSSFSSSISGGSKIRVSFPPIRSIFKKRGVPADDEQSTKSEKSTRFDDTLNEFKTYDPHDFEDDINTDWYSDDISVRSEGGKNNLWSQSLRFLDKHRFDVRVLGTSTDDETTKPLVLSLSIMENLQEYLPYAKRGECFWLKYSMVRDGANMDTLFTKVEGSRYNVIAIETLEGEVFGAFTGKPWNRKGQFFGSSESFLWRIKGVRESPKTRAKKPLGLESIEAFKFSGYNRNIQFSTSSHLAVGGGIPDDESSKMFPDVELTDWGFGLSFQSDLQQGTSSPCITFGSPSLSKIHHDGTRFEVANMEVWSFTPCLNLEEARKLENSNRIIERSLTF